jgi:hypothetical protein
MARRHQRADEESAVSKHLAAASTVADEEHAG